LVEILQHSCGIKLALIEQVSMQHEYEHQQDSRSSSQFSAVNYIHA